MQFASATPSLRFYTAMTGRPFMLTRYSMCPKRLPRNYDEVRAIRHRSLQLADSSRLRQPSTSAMFAQRAHILRETPFVERLLILVVLARSSLCRCLKTMIGAIVVYRQEVRPFSNEQIALVQ